MRITIGTDHAGFELKEAVKAHLIAAGHTVHDVGAYSTDCVDYPLIAAVVAREVSSGTAEMGVLTCGTGLGMAIAANKVRGIRAVQVNDTEFAEIARKHNDANVRIARRALRRRGRRLRHRRHLPVRPPSKAVATSVGSTRSRRWSASPRSPTTVSRRRKATTRHVIPLPR